MTYREAVDDVLRHLQPLELDGAVLHAAVQSYLAGWRPQTREDRDRWLGTTGVRGLGPTAPAGA